MLPLAAAAVALALPAPPDPGGWRFVDSGTLGGRSVLTFRTVELFDRPAFRLPAAAAPPVGARFGEIPLGPRAAPVRLPVVWHAATGALWVDADADGRFAPAERHALGDTPVELRVNIPDGANGTQPRTLFVRRRGDGLAHAIRGYRAGRVTLGSETFAAALTDGDADGRFDNPAADRVWVDGDRDGKFDPVSEQFPLGRPVPRAGRDHFVRVDPATGTVSTAPRPADTGELQLGVSRLRGSEVESFSAQLVSEWGELVTVTDAGARQTVPVGRYRVDEVRVRLKAADGSAWDYRFGGPAAFLVTVAKDRPAALDLTAGPRLAVRVGQWGADGTYEVSPAVVTAPGLVLWGCERTDRFSARGDGVEAAVWVEAPGSAPVCESRAGFMCGKLEGRPVRVPAAVEETKLEVIVRFPSGPLAGELRGAAPLPAPPKK